MGGRVEYFLRNKLKERNLNIEELLRNSYFVLKRRNISILPFFNLNTSFMNNSSFLNVLEKEHYTKGDESLKGLINFSIKNNEIGGLGYLNNLNGRTISIFSITSLVRVFSHLGCVQNFFKPFWKSFLIGTYYNTSLINLNVSIIMFKFFSSILLKAFSKYFNRYLKLFFFDCEIKKKYVKELGLFFLSDHYYSSKWFFGNLTNLDFLFKKMNQKDYITFDFGFPFLTFLLGTGNKNSKFFLKEFSSFNLPTIKLCDTNSSHSFLQYIIPSNTKIILPRLFYLFSINKILMKIEIFNIKSVAADYFNSIFKVLKNKDFFNRRLYYLPTTKGVFNNFSNSLSPFRTDIYNSFKFKNYFVWYRINTDWFKKTRRHEGWKIRTMKNSWDNKIRFWDYLKVRVHIPYYKKTRRKGGWDWKRKRFYKNRFNFFKKLLRDEAKK